MGAGVKVEVSGAKLAPSEACSLTPSRLAEFGSRSLASILGGSFSSQEVPLRVLSAGKRGPSAHAPAVLMHRAATDLLRGVSDHGGVERPQVGDR